MLRSEINAAIEYAAVLAAKHQFLLPDFARFSPAEWAEKGPEYDEIRDNMLGWDVTTFGSADFAKIGLTLFTIRNGNHHNPKYPKPYAEKIMVVREGQVTPYHFHFIKMEDIINRGGGNLVVKLYNATPDEAPDETSPVDVYMDGRHFIMPAGAEIIVTPGASITLPPRQYHSFYSEVGSGSVLVGEVSVVNDDANDNRFYIPLLRYPDIIEDEPARHLLCNEYPAV